MILTERGRAPENLGSNEQEKVDKFVREWSPNHSAFGRPDVDWLLSGREGKLLDTKKRLLKLFLGKCPFCETSFNKSSISNSSQGLLDSRLVKGIYYRPYNTFAEEYETGNPYYFWLVAQWPNIYIGCSACYAAYERYTRNWAYFPIRGKRAAPGVYHVKKLNELEKPQILDPCYDSPSKYLEFYTEAEGQVCLRGIDASKRGSDTITAFGLNRTELRERRSTSAAPFNQLLNDINELSIDLASKELTDKINLLEKHVQPNAEFAGMKRQLLLQFLKTIPGTPLHSRLYPLTKKWTTKPSIHHLRPAPEPNRSVRETARRDTTPTIPDKPHIHWDEVAADDDQMPLSESIKKIIETVLKKMFADRDEVIVIGFFSSGYSGAKVLHVRPKKDRKGMLPCVVKIDLDLRINKEYDKYLEYVKDKVPDVAPPKPPVTSGQGYSGLQYPLVGSELSKISSLRKYVEENDLKNVFLILGEDLFPRMERFWSKEEEDLYYWRRYDQMLPANLELEHLSETQESYNFEITPENFAGKDVEVDTIAKVSGFQVSEVDPDEITLNTSVLDYPDVYRIKVKFFNNTIPPYRDRQRLTIPLFGKVLKTRKQILRSKAEEALGKSFASKFNLASKEIAFPDGSKLANPILVLEKILNDRSYFSDVHLSPIHGDLNLENILVKHYEDKSPKGIELIDFASARKDHVLHDFLRLETGIWLYIASKELSQKRALSKQIGAFFEAVHIDSELVSDFADLKSYHIIRKIRQQARSYLRNQHRWEEYFRGLLLYMLGALKYSNLDEIDTNPSPKALAFWLACLSYRFFNGRSAGQSSGFDPTDPPPDHGKSRPGTKANDGKQNNSQEHFYKKIAQHFNLAELRQMCYDLSKSLNESDLFENLPGTTLTEKALALVGYCQRRGQVDLLIAYCEKERPYVNWRELRW